MKEIEPHLRLLGEYRVACVIVGGVAAIHGSSQLTFDLDICYLRDLSNLTRLVQALLSVNAKLRGAADGLPFILDEEMLRRGLNFTFVTDHGSLDLLGEVSGVGGYQEAIENAEIEFFGTAFPVLSLTKLIAAKRAAGRPRTKHSPRAGSNT